MSEGILFIVSAPSGAGKTSLVKALLESEPGLGLAISFTTRQPRPGEVDGTHYHFIDEARFLAMIDSGAFLEHAQVFGNRYGTAEAKVREALREGRDLLLEIDWQGARQVRAQVAGSVSVFILPPSRRELERRLRARASDSEAVIARRLADSREDSAHAAEFDYLVVNDRFEDALGDLLAIVAAQRLRSSNQLCRHAALLDDLLRAPD